MLSTMFQDSNIAPTCGFSAALGVVKSVTSSSVFGMASILSITLMQCTPLLVALQDHMLDLHHFRQSGKFFILLLTLVALSLVFSSNGGSISLAGLSSSVFRTNSLPPSYVSSNAATCDAVTRLWRAVFFVFSELAKLRVEVIKICKDYDTRYFNVELAIADLHSRLDLAAKEKVELLAFVIGIAHALAAHFEQVLVRRIAESERTSARKDATAKEFQFRMQTQIDALKQSVEDSKSGDSECEHHDTNLKVEAPQPEVVTEQIRNLIKAEFSTVKQSLMVSEAREARLTLEVDAIKESLVRAKDSEVQLKAQVNAMQRSITCSEESEAQLKAEVRSLKRSLAHAEMNAKTLEGHSKARIDVLEASLAEQKADWTTRLSDVNSQISQFQKEDAGFKDDLHAVLGKYFDKLFSEAEGYSKQIPLVENRIAKLEAIVVQGTLLATQDSEGAQARKDARRAKALALAAAAATSSSVNHTAVLEGCVGLEDTPTATIKPCAVKVHKTGPQLSDIMSIPTGVDPTPAVSRKLKQPATKSSIKPPTTFKFASICAL